MPFLVSTSQIFLGMSFDQALGHTCSWGGGGKVFGATAVVGHPLRFAAIFQKSKKIFKIVFGGIMATARSKIWIISLNYIGFSIHF